MVNFTKEGRQYLEEWKRLRQDFSNNIPNDKKVVVFPKSGNEGILAYTDLASEIGVREDIPVNSDNYQKYRWHHEGRHPRSWEYLALLIEEMSFEMSQPKKKEVYGASPPDYSS